MGVGSINNWQIGAAVLVVAAAIVAVYVMYAPSGPDKHSITVQRDLPDNITAGDPFKVSLQVRSGAPVEVDIRDSAQDRIAVINGSALHSSVKANRTISYYAYVPLRATGQVRFNGTYSNSSGTYRIGGEWRAPVERPDYLFRIDAPATTTDRSVTAQILKTVYPALENTDIHIDISDGNITQSTIQRDYKKGTGVVERLNVSLPAAGPVKITGYSLIPQGPYPLGSATILVRRQEGGAVRG
ncbi:MAG: hypothetical protein SVU32_07385 [Candidatus Nanohaloarchaea archaeon]|nr:hypothetical protein [Candidatus Nanohaloarchaea archaeon]